MAAVGTLTAGLMTSTTLAQLQGVVRLALADMSGFVCSNCRLLVDEHIAEAAVAYNDACSRANNVYAAFCAHHHHMRLASGLDASLIVSDQLQALDRATQEIQELKAAVYNGLRVTATDTAVGVTVTGET